MRFKILRSTNLESKLIKFVKLHTVRFGSLQPFTVRETGDFPHFLSALASNNAFIIKLVKIWPVGGGLNFEDKLRSTYYTPSEKKITPQVERKLHPKWKEKRKL